MKTKSVRGGVDPPATPQRAQPWRLLLALCALVYSVVVAELVIIDASETYRAPLVLLFILTGPGAAVVLLLRIGRLLVQLVLTVAISLAVGVLVPSAMLYAGWWSPRDALVLLALITGVVSSAGFVLELRLWRSSVRLRMLEASRQ